MQEIEKLSAFGAWLVSNYHANEMTATDILLAVSDYLARREEVAARIRKLQMKHNPETEEEDEVQ